MPKRQEKKSKSKALQSLIHTTCEILSEIGIPMSELSDRRKELMALSVMALGGIKRSWTENNQIKPLRSRDIIEFLQNHYDENISSGSYDDIRRKHLKYPVLSNAVIRSKPNAATNDGTRGYLLNPEFKDLAASFRTLEWEMKLKTFIGTNSWLDKKLSRERNLPKIPVALPDGLHVELSQGKHNELQKAIIEEFLPRFTSEPEVLYVGDTSNKGLHKNEKRLSQIGFFELSHEELPDVIAYMPSNNWLFLIEAVHSTGPMSEERLLQLKKLTATCSAEIVYVTAFLTKKDFQKWSGQIGWETEVWIAERPDHMIHYNGEKFLGPYKKE